MTLKEYAKLTSNFRRFENQVFEVLPLWCELQRRNAQVLGKPVHCKEQYLDEVTSFDDNEVTVEGDEYWRYGGHEHYCEIIPIYFIFSQEARNKYVKEIEVLEAKAEEDRLIKQKKKDAEEVCRRRIQYEKLKAEFEDGES